MPKKSTKKQKDKWLKQVGTNSANSSVIDMRMLSKEEREVYNWLDQKLNEAGLRGDEDAFEKYMRCWRFFRIKHRLNWKVKREWDREKGRRDEYESENVDYFKKSNEVIRPG